MVCAFSSLSLASSEADGLALPLRTRPHWGPSRYPPTTYLLAQELPEASNRLVLAEGRWSFLGYSLESTAAGSPEA